MECQHKGFVEEHGSGGFTNTPSLVVFFVFFGGREGGYLEDHPMTCK